MEDGINGFLVLSVEEAMGRTIHLMWDEALRERLEYITGLLETSYDRA